MKKTSGASTPNLIKHTNQGMAGFTYKTLDSSFFVKHTNIEHAMHQAKNEIAFVKSTSDVHFADILLKNLVINKSEYDSLQQITKASERNDFLHKVRGEYQEQYAKCLDEYSKTLDFDKQWLEEYSKKLLEAEKFGINIEYLGLIILNLLHLKTPGELLLNQNSDNTTIIKRAIGDSDLKNSISRDTNNENVDIDWFIRRQTVLMLLNIVDASINMPNHNTIQLKKDGKIRYADIDPIIIASNFKDLPFDAQKGSWFARQRQKVINAEQNINSISSDNFFIRLKEFSKLNSEISTDNQQIKDSSYLANWMNDIDTNAEKQIQIINSLQKTLYYLKQNKAEIFKEIKNFGDKNINIEYTSNFNPYLPKTSNKEAVKILENKINKLPIVLENLKSKFPDKITDYDPDTKNYTSRKIYNKLNLNSIENLGIINNNNNCIQYYNGGSFYIRHGQLTMFTTKRLANNDAYYFECNEENLTKLQNTYRSVKGLPKFIDNIFSLKRGWNLEKMSQNSDLFRLVKSDVAMFLLKPNPQYVEDEYIKNPKNLKNKQKGFGLIAWYIHKHYYENSEFTQIINLPKEEKEKLINEKIKDQVFLDDITKNQNAIPIGSIESQYSKEDNYWSSVIDIDVQHLAAIKRLKQQTIEYLNEVYDIDVESCNDFVTMYFHIPLPDVTTTAHLHIRVNQGINPLDAANSITLDEIIKCLEKGHSVKQHLCESRKTILFPVGDFKGFAKQSNLDIFKINNPTANMEKVDQNPLVQLLRKDNSLVVKKNTIQKKSTQLIEKDSKRLCNSM